MKAVYNSYGNYSFWFDPDTLRFKCFYHRFEDDRETVFLEGKVTHADGGDVHVQQEPGYEQKVINGMSREHIFTYRGEDLTHHCDVFFQMLPDDMVIKFHGRIIFSGTINWSENVEDTFSCQYDSRSLMLQGSSGPATSAADNMVFDRKNDRALRFTPRGNFELRFDWEKNAYTFRFSPKEGVPQKSLRLKVFENFVAQNMNMRYTPIDKKNQFPTPPVGWMTWYATRFDACEKEVLENTAKLKETFGNYTDKLVSWVDWEWYHKNIKGDGEGDGNIFSPCKDSYPNGLAFVAEKIKEMGVIPAIWVGPTCEGNKNKWFEAHPDCIIGPYPRWCGQWWVNPVKAEVVNEYIPMVMDQVKDWGYEVVKWDCQTMTSYVWEEYWDELGTPEISVDQLEHRIIESGRRALGDNVYLLLCNPVCDHDISVGSDLCDAARIGADIFNWDEFLEHAIGHLFHFYPIHNTMLYADCDNIVIRSEYNTIEQARTRVSFYGLSGVPVTLGDRFREYDDQRIDMLRRIVPVVDMNPVELVSKKVSGVSRKFLARFARRFGSWQVISVTNTDKENLLEEVICFDPDCGLKTGNGEKYAVYDFWNSRLIGVFEKDVTITVAPNDTAVLRITPVENDGLPVLVSSSRHITQGGCELTDMCRKEKSLSGKVICAAGEPCKLSFFIPEGVCVTASGGVWEQKDSCGVLTVENASGGEAAWRLDVK